MPWSYAPDASVHNFPALVMKRMKAPSALFIGDGEGRSLTYADYWSLAGQMANVLAAHGVRRGDRVAVQVEKSIEGLALFLACARLGAVLLPLNTAYTVAELDYFIGDAEPALVMCTTARADAIGTLASKHGCQALLTLDADGKGSFMAASNGQPRSFMDARTGWDDLIAILYTSGTTGRSKGAMLTHGNLASNALALAEAWQFTAADVLYHALPVYHTHGLFTASNTMLMSGGRMIFRAKFDANDAITRLPQATAMMGVPTFYTRLLQHPGLTRELTTHMRLFVSGSAPLLAETHREFLERTGHAILERYGMTETNMNTSNPYRGDRRAGTVGIPLPGVDLRITDPASGAALPRGEIGMIEVRGPNVFKGYWKMPEKTAAEMKPYTGRIPKAGKEYQMVVIPGGEFLLGSPPAEKNRKDDEGPQVKVKIEPFWMGAHEVPWDLYMAFMLTPDARFKDGAKKNPKPDDTIVDAVSSPTAPYTDMTFGMGQDGFPAISMTEHAASKFCQWLSAQTGHFYRLPTEAEWEYAARAGTSSAYFWGDDAAQLGDYAWFFDNSDGKSQPVGKKKPSPWGLYDICGNVAEWTLDQYDPNFYATIGTGAVSPFNQPVTLYPRVVRGGSWDDDPKDLRSASRRFSRDTWKQQDPQLPKSIWYHTNAQFLGFRVVRPLAVPSPDKMHLYWNLGLVNKQ